MILQKKYLLLPIFLCATINCYADSARYSKYNPNLAVEYANKWAKSQNSQYPNYAKNLLDGGNCTNFVSQALHTGGWQYTNSRNDKDAGTWYVSYDKKTKKFRNSQTWSTASGFYNRIVNYKYEKSAQVLTDMYSLKKGDIVFLVDNNKAYHTMIVTGYKEKSWIPFTSYGPLLSYQNSARFEPQNNITIQEVIARSPKTAKVVAVRINS